MKSIILFVLLIVLITHYVRYEIQNTGSIFGKKILEVPYDIKCYFEEDRCDEGDIDMWAVLYFIVSIISGYLVPDNHIGYALLAVSFEIIMPYVGYSSRYIINPLVAITGYSIGHQLHKLYDKYELKEKYTIVEKLK